MGFFSNTPPSCDFLSHFENDRISQKLRRSSQPVCIYNRSLHKDTYETLGRSMITRITIYTRQRTLCWDVALHVLKFPGISKKSYICTLAVQNQQKGVQRHDRGYVPPQEWRIKHSEGHMAAPPKGGGRHDYLVNLILFEYLSFKELFHSPQSNERLNQQNRRGC